MEWNGGVRLEFGGDNDEMTGMKEIVSSVKWVAQNA